MNGKPDHLVKFAAPPLKDHLDIFLSAIFREFGMAHLGIVVLIQENMSSREQRERFGKGSQTRHDKAGI
jgi:hypothetical protein